MELSLLCDVKVFLFLYDRNNEQKILHYQSDEQEDFNQYFFKKVANLSHNNSLGQHINNSGVCNPKNFFSNKNVSLLSLVFLKLTLRWINFSTKTSHQPKQVKAHQESH